MRLALRLYALSIHLLPRDLRERFGAEMIDLLERRIAQASSMAERRRVLAGAVSDVLVQAVAARSSKRTSRRGVSKRHAAKSMTRERRRDQLGVRDLWSWEGFVDKLFFNVRYAVRRLRKSPVFTLVAIVSLGLGIGANTAMFSLVNAIVIRDLPLEDPETLVNVYGTASGSTLSYPDFEDLAEGSTDVFAGVSWVISSRRTILFRC